MSKINIIDVSTQFVFPSDSQYNNIDDYYPYGVVFGRNRNSSKIFREAREWSKASFGDMFGTKWHDRRYYVGPVSRCILFKNQADFNWFLMRWL